MNETPITVIFINYNNIDPTIHFKNTDFDIHNVFSVKFPYDYSIILNKEIESLLTYLKAINTAIEINKDKVIICDQLIDIDKIKSIYESKENLVYINSLNGFMLNSKLYHKFKIQLIKTYKKLIDTKNTFKYSFHKIICKLYKDELIGR
jgi:hypothetical protein